MSEKRYPKYSFITYPYICNECGITVYENKGEATERQLCDPCFQTLGDKCEDLGHWEYDYKWNEAGERETIGLFVEEPKNESK